MKKVNYDSARDAPLILNETVIGIIKKYHKSGIIECILWDNYTNKEIKSDEQENGIISSVLIEPILEE